MAPGVMAKRKKTVEGLETKTEEKIESRGSLESPPAPLPAPPEPAPEAKALIARLAGRTAREVLARISDGDPLRLYPLCAHRTRERYFVVDPDRVFERALSSVAVGMEIDSSGCERADWLIERIDAALRSVLEEDREAERTGARTESGFLDPKYLVFVEAFGTEPARARSAAVQFNGLDERARKAFFHLLVDGESVEACLQRGLGPPDRLRNDVLTALWALGHLDDAELKSMLVELEEGA